MSERPLSLLLVDDDQWIVDSLVLYLSESGFDVHVCMRWDEALERFRAIQPDVILLDINLPGKDGLSVLQEIRALSSVPILMLSARDDQTNISTSFESEADDYIGKPFSPKEVIMRIRAILRRGMSSRVSPTAFSYRDLRLFENEFRVTRGTTQVILTKSEFQILHFIVSRAGQVVSRDDLMREMGYANFLYDRTIDTHIKNIRHKIGDDVILTVRGVGYRSY